MMKHTYKQLLTLGATATLLLIGTTTAYFANQDVITNVFGVAGAAADVLPNVGIEIWEDFGNGDGHDGYFNYDTPGNSTGNPEPALNVLPNADVTKKVHVRSTVNYNQFVRVSLDKYYTVTFNDTVSKVKSVYGNTAYLIDPNFEVTGYELEDGTYLDANGAPVGTPSGTQYQLDQNAIQLQFVNETQWLEVAGDADIASGSEYGYYYYTDILPAGGQTTDVLASVKLSDQMSSVYKGLGFNVDVYAQAIQATQEVLESEWGLAKINPPTLVTP